ncbi:MAG: SOS response-associated peptidase [Candidatus Obscuribacterales bacterium]|nr:SOS response-associated peptidase [Candidatus Obscuribacterales bacterium]
MSERFGVKQLAVDLVPRYNIAPTQSVPVVLRSGALDEIAIEMMRWGLVPYWVKDPKSSKPMINARAETLIEKASFKHCLVRRRCLIPCDGFYEWRKEGKAKVPMFIHGAAARDLFAFAGLWDEWTNKETGEKLRSCTIITTEANRLMSSVHDRMPVILRPSDEATWLDHSVNDPLKLTALLCPATEDRLAMYEVSSKVNKASVESPDLIEPAPKQPSLFA